MEVLKIRLSDRFPFLGNGKGVLTCYIQKGIHEPGYVETPPRPAMLILPGGGYFHCSPREGEPVAMSFMDLGIHCFVLEYSVAPEHRWPQALLEVSAALELIRSNAESWNIDPEKLLISGFSAGGHLAASYCTLRNREEITAHITPPNLAGAVLCYPVITADPALRHTGSFQGLTGEDEVSSESIAAFSLERHVRKGVTPPTFLWHTAADGAVPVENSLLYASALSREKIPFALHIFPEGGHGLATADKRTVEESALNPQVGQWIGLAKVWIRDLLGL